MRKKEIGGYLELENLSGEDYYAKLHHLNLGRTAVAVLMQALKSRKIMLPWFICDSVTDACKKAGLDIRFYHVDSSLRPVIETPPSDNEYLYIINYYGQLTDSELQDYKNKYARIIVDNTHAFFQRPVDDIPTIYSVRKFFGLPDGAILSYGGTLPELKEDFSSDRMRHILGRYERDASTYYKDMLDTAETFHNAPALKMSRLTRNLMRGIDYEAARERRNNNFKELKSRLEKFEERKFEVPNGPFCFPFYTKKAADIRRSLAGKKIFVPTYWNNVINEMSHDSTEYDLASNILALPCDQRLSLDDMSAVADELIKLLN